MGALKLTYQQENPTLKVVWNSLKDKEKLCTGGYRYGFNGKEKDDEWNGVTGAMYDYGFRIYDSRIARFLSVDPLTKSYPWYTPYQFAGNNPIAFIDLDGLEEAKPVVRTNVIISITTDTEVNSRVQSGTVSNPMGSYQVIYAKDFDDANNRMQKYMKGNDIKELDNLVIRTHGGGTSNPGKISTGKGAISEKTISAYNNGKLNTSSEGYKQIKGLDDMSASVKKTGNLVITSCGAARDLPGVLLGSELQTLTESKLNIYLNQDNSTNIYDDDDLQIWKDGGLTDKVDQGWVVIPEGGTQKNLKDPSKNIEGNVQLDSRKGKEPVKVK